MTERPGDQTQPIAADATAAHSPVDAAAPAPDAAAPAAAAGTPAWANAAHEGDATASASRPVRGADAAPAPIGSVGAPVPVVAAAQPPRSWRSRVSSGRGLAVAALVVGLGVGAVGGSAATFAATHDGGTGAVADGVGGFDRDGDLGPRGRHDGPPPGGRMPGGDQQQGGDGGTTGQVPGGRPGRPGSDGSTGGPGTGGTGEDSTHANGTSQVT